MLPDLISTRPNPTQPDLDPTRPDTPSGLRPYLNISPMPQWEAAPSSGEKTHFLKLSHRRKQSKKS